MRRHTILVLVLFALGLVFMPGVASADHADYNYSVDFRTHEPGATGSILINGEIAFDTEQMGGATVIGPGWAGVDDLEHQPAGPGSFDFSDCGVDAARSYGKDIGGNNSGAQVDVNWVPYIAETSIQEHYIKVLHNTNSAFGNEDALEVLGESRGDQVVTLSEECVVLPEKPGWYQIASTYPDTPEANDRAYTSHFYRVGSTDQVGPKPTTEHTASISMEDQESPGNVVTVSNVDMSHGGFLAVYDTDPANAGPDDVIGVTSHLGHDFQGSVDIPLTEEIQENGQVWVVPHVDINRDQQFQYVESDGTKDRPYTGQNPYQVDEIDGSKVISESAQITVEEPDATASYEVSGFNAPETVSEGQSYTVEATVENTGEGTTTEVLEYQIDGETVQSTTVELEPGQSDTVSLEVGGAGVDAGTYEHGLVIAGSSVTGELTVEAVEGAVFTLTVNAPQQAALDEDMIFDAIVRNTGDQSGSTTTTITVDGETVKEETVALEPGENATVTAFVVAEELGQVEYSVSAGSESRSGSVEVVEKGEAATDTQAGEGDQNGGSNDQEETPSGDGPGFGAEVGMLAIVLSALLARRISAG